MISIVTINHSATLLVGTIILQCLEMEVIIVNILCFLSNICSFGKFLLSPFYADGSINHMLLKYPILLAKIIGSKIEDYPRKANQNFFLELDAQTIVFQRENLSEN